MKKSSILQVIETRANSCKSVISFCSSCTFRKSYLNLISLTVMVLVSKNLSLSDLFWNTGCNNHTGSN